VSASEVKETNIYLFNVAFILSSQQDAQGLVSGNMQIFGPFEGLEVHAEADDDVDVLIGMNIIARGAFHVGFDGRYLFSW